MISMKAPSCDFIAGSEESDDLNSALEVWQKYFASVQSKPVAADNSSETHLAAQQMHSEKKVQVTSGFKKKLRRRRIASHEERRIVWSESDSSDKETLVSKKRLRPKTRKRKNFKRRKPAREENDTEISEFAESQVEVTDERILNIDENSPIEQSIAVTRSIPALRRSKRLRGSPHKRANTKKPPLMFLETSAQSPSAKSSKRKSTRSMLDDEESELTAESSLLGTPEFSDNFEVASREELERVPDKQDDKSFTVSKNLDTDNREKMSAVHEQSAVSSDVSSCNKDTSARKHGSSGIETSPLVVDTTVTSLPSTALDDIFFESNHTSLKKPPPTRSSKKSHIHEDEIYTSPLSILRFSTNQNEQSSCTSLLDDDSLWAYKDAL